MRAPDDGAARQLDALRTLLVTARGLIDDLATDPTLERLLRAFLALPESDRETIVGVLERDATWTRIAEQTAGSTGIRVRPNPHASLYVHVFDQVTGQPLEPEPSERDADVIRLGVERLVRIAPLLFQEGVYAQWTASARELMRTPDPELRGSVARLAREVLALVAAAVEPDLSTTK